MLSSNNHLHKLGCRRSERESRAEKVVDLRLRERESSAERNGKKKEEKKKERREKRED
jgi:hypothetical protein